jgi:hypothetical protein
VRFSNLDRRWTIQGRRALLHSDDAHWFLTIVGKSKRHFSSIRKQLNFMELTTDDEDRGTFRSDTMPTEAEATLIRKLGGLNKVPTLTEERVKQLQNNAIHFARASV